MTAVRPAEERFGKYVHTECDKRIRELEADYRREQEGRRAIEALWTEQKTRTEKAELGWGPCKRMLEDRNDSLNKAEARIAELEAMFPKIGFAVLREREAA